MTLAVKNGDRTMFNLVLVNTCAGNEPAYQVLTPAGEMVSLLWTRAEAANVIRDWRTRYEVV